MTMNADEARKTIESLNAVGSPVVRPVRPCPFCGGTNGTDQMGETYRWRRWECNDCGAKGPEVRCNISGAGRGGEAEARQLALEAWNERDNADALAERARWTEAVMAELDGNGQAHAIVAYATRA